MKNTFSNYLIILPALFLSLIATILRCIASVTDMDYITGFYNGSVLIKISNVVITAAVIILLLSLFLKEKRVSFSADSRKPWAYFPMCILSVSVLVAGINILEYLSFHTDGNILADLSSHRSFIVALIAIALAFLTVILCAASLIATKLNSIRGIFNMSAAIFFGIYATFLFFRLGDTINQPQKIVTEMAALALSVFLLENARVYIGRERPNSYLVLGIIAAIMSAYAAIPALAASLFNGRIIAFSIEEMILMTSGFIFAVYKLATVLLFSKEEKTPIIADEDTESTSEVCDEECQSENERLIRDEEDSGN